MILLTEASSREWWIVDTWPQAILGAVIVLAIAWVVVTLIKAD